jgi:FkbM family methyltransferase
VRGRTHLSAARRKLQKARKLATVLAHPSYRRALRHRVAAATEHHSVAFEHCFATVIDVGANRGQFSLFAARRFPAAELHCFEPLPEARSKLVRALGRDSRRLHVYDAALGASSGPETFNVSASDDSSSLLVPTTTQTATFPNTGLAEHRTVEVARLDRVIAPQVVTRPCLLKLDVQGYELEVLRGADALLESLDELLIECSFVELYEHQPLAGEIVSHCAERSFRLAGIFSLVRDDSGRCLQADFLFVRSA